MSKDAASRRVALKSEIAKTTDALKAAQTDEVQKLTGVLIGLSAALNNTDYEISQATSAALVQDIANRSDAQRQVEAKKKDNTPSSPKRWTNTARRSGCSTRR